MKIQKNYSIDEIKIVEGAEGVVEAYVNTMGIVDKDNDVISPDAFDKSILGNMPVPVLSGHDHASLVGKVISASPEKFSDDEHRLRATIQMNMETQSGREAYSNIAGKYVREWSVGFNVPNPDEDIEYVEDKTKGKPYGSIRRIKNLDWVEVSTVIRGASPSTQTILAKQEPTERSEPEVQEDTASDTTEVALDTELIAKQIEVARLRLQLKERGE